MKYMMLINLGPEARDWQSLPDDVGALNNQGLALRAN